MYAAIIGHLKDGVVYPDPKGKPIPIGAADPERRTLRVAPNMVVITAGCPVPPDLAADLGGYEIVEEAPKKGEVHEGVQELKDAKVVGGKLVRKLINRKKVEPEGEVAFEDINPEHIRIAQAIRIQSSLESVFGKRVSLDAAFKILDGETGEKKGKKETKTK
jgi:hypothetical protein